MATCTLVPASVAARAGGLLLVALVALSPAPAPAQPEEAPARSQPSEQSGGDRGRLPAAHTTRHELPLEGRTLAFDATAGSITLTKEDEPEADVAFVAYMLDGADPATRPVTFAVNGGPGAASAYLHLGVLGPWQLPLDAETIVPSQPTALVANPDTWLDFTDLVFVDPVGTGFSRLAESSDRLRDRYLSIDGDIDALADFVVRWLTENGRIRSPKYYVGESYGGFRGPLLADKLESDSGVALNGMILLSPVLDFGWWLQPDHAPLPKVALLPALAAAAMESQGSFDAEKLKAAEDYAAGDYLTDLLRGVGDEAAVARTVARVSELTGLDPIAVERVSGRVDSQDFAREILRGNGRRISFYDAAVGSEVMDRRSRSNDPVLDAMTAPLTSAMIGLYQDTLGWLPDRRYILLNGGVTRAWDWDAGRRQPEAVDALREVLDLDPEFRLLVAHGYTDLVTPYFASELILRQVPVSGDPGRVRQANYRGGHMFYTRPESREAFRADARALYQARGGAGAD